MMMDGRVLVLTVYADNLGSLHVTNLYQSGCNANTIFHAALHCTDSCFGRSTQTTGARDIWCSQGTCWWSDTSACARNAGIVCSKSGHTYTHMVIGAGAEQTTSSASAFFLFR